MVTVRTQRMSLLRRRALIVTGALAGAVAVALTVAAVELVSALVRADDADPWDDGNTP